MYTSLLSFDQSIQDIALDKEHLMDQSTNIPQLDGDSDITCTGMAAVQYALQRKTNPNKETEPLHREFCGVFRKGETYKKQSGVQGLVYRKSCGGTPTWFQYGQEQRVQYTDRQGVCHSKASVDFLLNFSMDDAKMRVNKRMKKWGRLLGDRRLKYVKHHRKAQYMRGKARVNADNLH